MTRVSAARPAGLVATDTEVAKPFGLLLTSDSCLLEHPLIAEQFVELHHKTVIARLGEAPRVQRGGVAVLGVNDEQLAARLILPAEPKVGAVRARQNGNPG